MAYLRLRQVCLVASDLAAQEERFKSVLGLQPCYRDPNVRRYGLENVLFPVGQDFIEIVSPTQPGTAAGRFLDQRSGRGGYMVIFDCDDPAQRRQHAEDMGIRIANALQYQTYYGVQLHPRDSGAAMIEFNHTVGGENLDGPYHPAGSNWQDAVRIDTTSRLLAVDIEAPDPAAIAARWAEILEVPVTRTDAGRLELALGESRIRFTPGTAVDQPQFSGIEVQVSDRPSVLRAAAAAGCMTDGSCIQLCGIKISLSERHQGAG
jgi:catechol 2,3-dioxygenase-like lactoylglutathione lyase family enzyme